jgi:predicted DNA-binding transcriptional regulator YafY
VARELEPYGLVLKAGVWYLCARVVRSESFRVYRIDRFTAVDGAEERFTRDEAFELPAFWEERAEQFARSILRAEVVVRLSRDGVRRLPYAVDSPAAREALDTAGGPGDDGWVTVTLAVESEEVAHTQLSALGPEVEVLAPESLRRRFAEDARRLAGLYGTGAGLYGT